MKRLLSALFLLAAAAPLFANDEGGTPGYIPDYQELVREGYGPRLYVRAPLVIDAVPKPTQAYYGKGYTVYYNYIPVPAPRERSNLIYAFGYPADYFRKMMPEGVTDINLNHYAIAVSNPTSMYGPGDFIAQQRASHGNAVTTVRATTAAKASSSGANPLPAIGEKPAH